MTKEKTLIAMVKFQEYGNHYSDKEYAFFTKMTDLNEGNLVVVQNKNKLAIARFVGYTEECEIVPTKWVINKVDEDFHTSILQNEKKRNTLMNQMNRRAKLFDGINRLRLIAKFDPEMHRMLMEYDECLDYQTDYNVEEEIQKVLMKDTFVTN